MLLDELFTNLIPVKKVWIRKEGKMAKVSQPVKAQPDLHKQMKPMFPIQKPRYQ